MNEAEWMACDDPEPMLEFLHDRAGKRKLRLLAVGFCRCHADLLPDDSSRNAIAVAEQFADGDQSKESLLAAYKAVESSGLQRGSARSAIEAVRMAAAPEPEHPTSGKWHPPWLAAFHCRRSARDAVVLSVASANQRAGVKAAPAMRLARNGEHRYQGRLLRCIFGNPFRPVSVDASWLAWNDGAVRKMAHVIYDDRAFDRLPLLADALEDAGCTDAAILSHCREPGEHVRGCWVVDLLLGKE